MSPATIVAWDMGWANDMIRWSGRSARQPGDQGFADATCLPLQDTPGVSRT